MARKLDVDNVCLTCKVDATAGNIACVKCKCKFHVYNCSEDNLCTETILNSWKTWQNKYQCIQFLCQECLPSINNADHVSDKMADMEGKILTLNEEFTKLKKSLVKDIPPKPAAPPNNVQDQTGVAPAADHRSGVEDSHRLDAYEFQPLSPEDTSRAKKLLCFLNNGGLDRAKTKTVMIMDSNGNRIQNRQVDPDGGCKVIASGGLCIVSLVYALHEQEHKESGACGWYQ